MNYLITTIAALVLVGCGPSVDEFRKAVYDGEIETVKKAIAAGVDVNIKNKNRDTPLHVGVSGRSILDYPAKVMVELLITNGADVNAKDKSLETSLHFTTINGIKETAELLLTKVADVKTKCVEGYFTGQTPLDLAIRSENNVAYLFRKKGCKSGAVVILYFYICRKY